MKNNEYYGVYDQKESDTFRPTIEKRIHKDYPVSKTLATREDSCCVIERERESNLRIRKLSPTECMRLMGFTDEDTKAMYAAGMSDAQIYHCAGDSLITTLFGMLVGVMCIDEKELKERVENYIERIKNG